MNKRIIETLATFFSFWKWNFIEQKNLRNNSGSNDWEIKRFNPTFSDDTLQESLRAKRKWDTAYEYELDTKNRFVFRIFFDWALCRVFA